MKQKLSDQTLALTQAKPITETFTYEGREFLVDTVTGDIAIKGTEREILAWRDALPRDDVYYYNAFSVDVFQDACRKGLHNCEKDSTKQVILNATAVANALIPLKEMLNTFPSDPEQAIRNLKNQLDNYKTVLKQYMFDLNQTTNPLITNITSDLRRTLEYSQRQLDEQIKNLEEGSPPLDKNNIALLLSAQDRDTEHHIHSLGHFLNDQTNQLCEMLEKIVSYPEYENTQVSDQMVLSETPKAFADAGRSIKRQNSLAYKQYVNTHAQAKTEEDIAEGDGYYHITSYLPERTPAKINAFLSKLLGEKNASTPRETVLNWPQRTLNAYVQKNAELYDQLDKKPLRNSALLLGRILISPYLLLPLGLAITEFAVTFAISSIALGLDIARLTYQAAAIIITSPLSLFGRDDLAKNIIGIFGPSLTNRFQNFINQQRINDLGLENNTLITNLTQKPDRLGFLNTSPGEIASAIKFDVLINATRRFLFPEKKEPAPALAVMLQRSKEQAQINQVYEKSGIFKQNPPATPIIPHYHKPDTLETLRVGRSPVHALNEIMLGFNDSLIASFRQNYKLPSAVGYATAWATMGLNVLIPAAIVAKMHATGIAHILETPTSIFAKEFMGHTHIKGDPTTEFFSLILQWKAGNVSVELIASLSDTEKSFLDHITNNFEIYIPILALGMVSGYAFGMIPLISSPFAMPINALITETKVAHNGLMPLTSLEYLFVMGKMTYFLYSLGEVDWKKHPDKAESVCKACLNYVENKITEEQLVTKLKAIYGANFDDSKTKEFINNMSNSRTDATDTINQDQLKNRMEQISTAQKGIKQIRFKSLIQDDSLLRMSVSRKDFIDNLDFLRTTNPEKSRILKGVGIASKDDIQKWADENTYPIPLKPENNIERFYQARQNVADLIEALKDPESRFHQDMRHLTHKQRAQKFLEINQVIDKYNKEAFCLGVADQMITGEVRQNMTDAFVNRNLRIDYPAVVRLPVTLAYVILAPLRYLYREGRLFFNKNDPSVKTSIEMERAVDKVFFDDWSGIGRRTGYQLFYTTTQTVVMLAEIVAFIPYTLAWLIGKPTGLVTSPNPIVMLADLEYRLNRTPTYLANIIAAPIALLSYLNPYSDGTLSERFNRQQETIEFGFFRGRSNYTATAAAAHRGGNYSDVEAAAQQISLPGDEINSRLKDGHYKIRETAWKEHSHDKTVLSRTERFDREKNKLAIALNTTKNPFEKINNQSNNSNISQWLLTRNIAHEDKQLKSIYHNITTELRDWVRGKPSNKSDHLIEEISPSVKPK